MRRSSLALSLAALTLAASGCGGSPAAQRTNADIPGATTPATTTQAVVTQFSSHATYVRVADSVCKRANHVAAEGNREVAAALKANKVSAAADAVDRFTPRYRTLVERLSRLEPPPPDRAKVLAYLRIAEAQTNTLTLYSKAIRAGDASTMRALGAAQQKLAAAALQAAQGIGYRVCGR